MLVNWRRVMKKVMKEVIKQRNDISILLIMFLCCIMFIVKACTDEVVAKVDFTDQEEIYLKKLFGDLNKNAPEKTKEKVGVLLRENKDLLEKREANKNYEMSNKEYKLWKDIATLLDEETIKQFGEYTNAKQENNEVFDYGKGTLNNLKSTLSKKDWDKLAILRDKYFGILENKTEDSIVEIETEMKTILKKYKSLHSKTTILNLLDEKNQNNVGIFYIASDFRAIYQDNSKSGLNYLSLKEQKKLENNWNIITSILPEKLFANFNYLKFGGDGEFGTYAYVMALDDEGKSWSMTIDPDDIKDDGLFPYTIIHEVSHYLSLNEKQVEYLGDNLMTYPHDRYTDWECVAKDKSYLQEFYYTFWKDIINDRMIDPENNYFYDRHKSEFVTAYASTDCAEDFSESFSAYVLLKKAYTPEIQKKFDFFDNYPELGQIKQDILNKIEKNNIYVNSKIELTNE